MARRGVRVVALALVLVIGHTTGALTTAWGWATTGWSEVQSVVTGQPVASSYSWNDRHGDETAFAFSATGPDGSPATWVCGPISVVINPSGAPAGAVDDFIEAIDIVAQASGLPFRYDGLTELPLTDGWHPAPPGADQPPVLVGWVTPESGLVDEVTGARATTRFRTNAHTKEIVTAKIAVNVNQDVRRAAGFDAVGSRGGVYLHELAHVAGLGHVDNPGQLMFTTTAINKGRFYDGDLAGFRALAEHREC